MFRKTLVAATAIAFTLPAFAATSTSTPAAADTAKPAATTTHKKLHKKHVQKQAEAAAAQSTSK